MYARKHHDSEGVELPIDFKVEFESLLEDTFSDKKPNNDYIFEVFGKIYPDEILLMVCFFHADNLGRIPVSCFISADVDENNAQRPHKILSMMVDLTGKFFDEYFAEEEFEDFEPNWQPTEFKNQQFYFKVTRENIALSLQADELLKGDIDN
jgi:hypothetical protein